MKKYLIRTSYKEWSAGTEVFLLKKTKQKAEVRHPATGRQFDIPLEYLVEKRERS